jgi:hypothetical protein
VPGEAEPGHRHIHGGIAVLEVAGDVYLRFAIDDLLEYR